jgi:hypothetical protein
VGRFLASEIQNFQIHRGRKLVFSSRFRFFSARAHGACVASMKVMGRFFVLFRLSAGARRNETANRGPKIAPTRQYSSVDLRDPANFTGLALFPAAHHQRKVEVSVGTPRSPYRTEPAERSDRMRMSVFRRRRAAQPRAPPTAPPSAKHAIPRSDSTPAHRQ